MESQKLDCFIRRKRQHHNKNVPLARVGPPPKRTKTNWNIEQTAKHTHATNRKQQHVPFSTAYPPLPTRKPKSFATTTPPLQTPDVNLNVSSSNPTISNPSISNQPLANTPEINIPLEAEFGVLPTHNASPQNMYNTSIDQRNYKPMFEELIVNDDDNMYNLPSELESTWDDEQMSIDSSYRAQPIETVLKGINMLHKQSKDFELYHDALTDYPIIQRTPDGSVLIMPVWRGRKGLSEKDFVHVTRHKCFGCTSGNGTICDHRIIASMIYDGNKSNLNLQVE